MKRTPKKRARDLTVYLLREGVSAEDAIQARNELRRFRVRLGDHEGELLVGRTRAPYPRWAEFFGGQVEPQQFGTVSSVSAVLLVNVSGRVQALTFGQGRFLLKPDSWEERFGFRVAINAVDPGQILSVDKQTMDSLGRHTRVQASRAARVAEFGIDYEQDLLRAVVGKPRDERLGLRVTGMNSLRATVRADLVALPALLARYIDKAAERSYKKDFPWIDHIRNITDKAVINELDDELTRRFNERNVDGVTLAVPTIVDWSDFETFRYESAGDSVEHNELALGDLLQLFTERERAWAPEDLRTVRVTTVQPDGQPKDQWTLHQCVFVEIERHGKTYVLSAGRWYQVNRGLVREVHDAFLAVPRLAPGLSPYADDDEKAYCERIASSDSHWALMDRKLVRYGGARNSVEFCDLFSISTKTLLHVKRYAGSAPLSHLFAQALVSGETFRSEPAFRVELNRLLPDSHKLGDCSRDPEGYRIVLGIAKANDFDLPFFSKVTLKNAVRRLRGFGFDVLLAHIEVSPEHAITKKAKKKAKHA